MYLAKCSEPAPAVTIAVHSPTLSLSGRLGSVGLVHKPRVFHVSPLSEVSTKRLRFLGARPAERKKWMGSSSRHQCVCRVCKLVVADLHAKEFEVG